MMISTVESFLSVGVEVVFVWFLLSNCFLTASYDISDWRADLSETEKFVGSS